MSPEMSRRLPIEVPSPGRLPGGGWPAATHSSVGAVAERAVGRAGPGAVVKIGCEGGVRGAARDDPSLELRVHVRLIAGDEARAERDALCTEGERPCNPGAVADPSRSEHWHRPYR